MDLSHMTTEQMPISPEYNDESNPIAVNGLNFAKIGSIDRGIY